MTLRQWTLVASIGCVFALGTACSSSSSPKGTGGAGGGVVATAGTSGASGAGGGGGETSGASGGTAGTSGIGGTAGTVDCGDLPPCVATLVAACPVASSACLVSASASGNTSTHDICFGSPATVKAVYSVTNDPNTGAGSTAVSVTKNGALCYTLDGTFNAQDPVTTPRILSFKNALGVEVATFTSDISVYPHTSTVTCTGGQSVAIASYGSCGRPEDPEPDVCTGGLCVAP